MLVFGFSATALAQATVYAANTHNSGVFNGAGGTPLSPSDTGNPVYSSLVTSNGLIFAFNPPGGTNTWGSQGGPAGSQLLAVDVSFNLYGGPTAASAAAETNLVLSVTGSAIAGDNVNWGQIYGPSVGLTVPGTTAASPVWLDLQMWIGNTYTTYFAALGNVDAGDTGPFLNPSGGGAIPPSSLSGMPDLLLDVPEPGLFALSSVGAAALFLFRRG